MAFQPLRDIADRIININIHVVINTIIQRKEFKDYIIHLNTNDQLFDEGIDSLGVSLGEYSPFTKEAKKEKGLPFDRITLFDEGDFHQSWEVDATNLNADYFEIKADPIKEDGTNLFKEFGINVLGLTEENTSKLSNKLIEAIRIELLRILQG